MTLFITKEQNLESPSHSSSYLVRPQQQQHTNTPLRIVPEIANMLIFFLNTALYLIVQTSWVDDVLLVLKVLK